MPGLLHVGAVNRKGNEGVMAKTGQWTSKFRLGPLIMFSVLDKVQ